MNRYLQLFSWNGPGRSSLRNNTNIINPGPALGRSNQTNDLEEISANCTTYTRYLYSIDRLQDYRSSELTETILDLYSDSIISILDKDTTEYITISNNPDLTDKINKILYDIDIISFISSNLRDFIYYGSYTKDLLSDFQSKDLVSPYTVVSTSNIDKYLINNNAGLVKTLTSVLRLSTDDLSLELDIENEDFRIKNDKDSFYIEDRVITGRPLFLSVELKIKEYVIKDLIISFLGIMKLIEQDTYTVDFQRMSDMDSITKVCESIKEMLVTKDDADILTSARLDKNALISRLFDNIRVIPSISQNLTSLQKLHGDRLEEKLNDLRNEKESIRDEILTNIGFPRDLFAGSTNRWEVARQSDRYNLKCLMYKDSIIKSVKNIVLNILYLMGESKVTENDINVNFISQSYSELLNLSQRIDVVNSTIRSVNEVLATSNELKNNDIITNKAFIDDYILKLLVTIDPKLKDIYKT